MSTGAEEIDDLIEGDIEIPAEFEPELVDILPKGYLSPSQLSTFSSCAHQWKLLYIDGKPRKTSARMFQGVSVHSAVEAVLKGRLVTGVLPTLEEATDTFSTAFDGNKENIDDWEDTAEGVVKDTGVRCTTAYYTEAAHKAMPVEVETTITRVIKSDDGKIRLPIFGRVDSIQVQAFNENEYQTIREAIKSDPKHQVTKPKQINDLKVVTNKWSEDKLSNSIQFAMYAGATGIPDAQVDMVVKGKATPPRVRYEALNGVITPGMVKHADNVALSIARDISAGSFRLTDPGNWNCSEKWCSMWTYCRGATLAAKYR